jgi:putative nucleotidyltransferase with HDIG domain
MTTTIQEQTKTREQAWELLRQYTKNPNLIKHALAVEAAMRYYARHFNEHEDVWGIVGLLHDFDYEQYPSLDEHPYKGQEILAREGYSDEIRRAIMAHAPHTGTSRDSLLEKTIFAVDELTGFIVAVTLVRPSKKLADVDVAAVQKKMKQPGFAKGVSRDDIALGAQELGFSIEEHMQHVLIAMQEIADELGL